MEHFDLEMHFWKSTPLTASEKRRIKKAGGRYSDARSSSDNRYITLPYEAAQLAQELVNKEVARRNSKRPLVVVCRTGLQSIGLPSWTIVHYYPGSGQNIMVWAREQYLAKRARYERDFVNGRKV